MGFLTSFADRMSSLARRLDGASAPLLPDLSASTSTSPRVDSEPRADGEARADCGDGGCGGYRMPWSLGGGLEGSLTDEAIESLCRSQLMWRIVTLLVHDAMKLIPDLSGPVAGDLGEVWDYLGERHFPAAEQAAMIYSRQYGGGAVAMVVDDGRTIDQPIDLLNVRDIVAFVPVRKRFITPGAASGQVRPAWWGQRILRPSYYTISPQTGADSELSIMETAGGGAGMSAVHPSRVIPYAYRRDYDLQQARRFPLWGGWGPGVVEAVADAFLARVKGVLRTGDIVNSFGYDFIKMPGLHDIGQARFSNFINWLKQCRDATGDGVPIVALGPEVESIEQSSRSVAGLADLIEAQRSFLLDVVEYPRVALFGTSAGGLSGKDEGEWQTHYQNVSTLCTGVRWPAIRQAAIVAMAARNGPTRGRVDMGIAAAWGSLAQERESDRSAARLADATAREKDAALLGLAPAELIRLDNTLERAYPGIQAEAAGGTLSLAPVPAGDLPPSPLASPLGAAPVAPASPAGGSEDGQGADAIPGGSAAAAPTPPPAPVSIPTDLVTRAEARRALRCGNGSFSRWVAEGKVKPWNTAAGPRYSLAEIVAASSGAPAAIDEDEDDGAESAADSSCRSDSGESRMDPFPNEHAARQKSPRGFDRFRRESLGGGVTLILGIKSGRTEVQSVRFKRSEWSPSEAKEWLREHGYRAGSFEAAVGGRSDLDAKGDQSYGTGERDA